MSSIPPRPPSISSQLSNDSIIRSTPPTRPPSPGPVKNLEAFHPLVGLAKILGASDQDVTNLATAKLEEKIQKSLNAGEPQVLPKDLYKLERAAGFSHKQAMFTGKTFLRKLRKDGLRLFDQNGNILARPKSILNSLIRAGKELSDGRDVVKIVK